jgi:hypothetical protein
MEELLMRVLERFTDRILTRQRGMYADPSVPFLEKWRKAMGYIDEDLAAGYPKIWFELQAMSWNRPEFRERVLQIHEQWHIVLTEAIENALDEYGIDRGKFPADAVSTLVRTFNLGLLLERVNEFDRGHDSLLATIDSLLKRFKTERA